MNVFTTLRHYATKWQEKSSRKFTEEEISAVSEATVVDSQYGTSVKFLMVYGGATYIPLEESSTLGIGETVDLTKAELVTLSKSGEADINRVRI